MKVAGFAIASLLVLNQTSVFGSASSDSASGEPRSSQTALKSATPALVANYGKLPLSFEANQGQSDPQVKFLSRGSGYSLFLTDSAAVLALTKRDPASGERRDRPAINEKSRVLSTKGSKTDVIRMELAGASKDLRVTGAEQLPGTANYFIGNDPKQWHTSVPTYAKVKYSGVYPGVDLVYYGNQRQLEYDFVVAPGANPNKVRLHFAGAKKLKLNADGDLEVIAKDGQIDFHKPTVYQTADGQRRPIKGQFTLSTKNTVAFSLGKFDRNLAVVIDPTLAYSTYLGGTGDSGSSTALAVAVDTTGSAYVTGFTGDPSFPVTADAYRSKNTNALNQPFVVKLNPAGTAPVYSTYFGGSGDDQSDAYDSAVAIAVDSSGNAYITGSTPSSDFPTTPGAYQMKPKKPGDDLAVPFVTKLNASGSSLVYSTYVGGSGDGADSDGASGIAVDSDGHAYITGGTWSSDFPVTKGAFQMSLDPTASANQTSNAFVTELNSDGSGLVYSTYLGGNGSLGPGEVGDIGNAIVVDKSGDAYLTGFTSSTNFPISGNAYQNKNTAGTKVFITEINPAGTSLLYSTYLGGTNGDTGEGIALDSDGNVYVTGNTFSTNFPTLNAFQSSNNSKLSDFPENAFVSKLNPTTGQLLYSTYLGGSMFDGAASIAVDSSGDAFVTGTAASANFPVTKATAYQPTLNGSGDAFVTELNSAGNALIYSTFLGGNQADNGVGIALDPAGNFYLAGDAGPNFPTTTDSYLPTGPNGNPFVAKFSRGTVASTTSLMISPASATVGQTITLTATVGPGQGESGLPTGTVTFNSGSTQLGTATLESNGTATFTTSSLTAGTYSISAIYSGDSTFLQSTSPTESLSVKAALPATTTSLTTSATTITFGSSVTLTATVSGPPGSMVAPTGTVTFLLNGTNTLGTATLNVSGATLTIATLPVGSDSITAQYGGDVNYDASTSSPKTISVVSAVISGLQFIPVAPCRVADTRNPTDPFGGPEMTARQSREFNIPQSACNIPSTAVAYSLNVTVVPSGPLGYLTLWPSGQMQPNASTLNSDGRVKANAAIVPAATNGGVSVFASDATQVILDIDGYFAPTGVTSGLAFYPVTPCRIADTRGAAGPLGGPSLPAGGSRSFPVQSSCTLPSSAQAYSLNVTAIPHSTLNYLTTWPTGETQPNVSTLNSSTGAVTANAAIVPAGTSGAVSVFVSDATDVILDVNGYFAPPATGGLSLYTASPCRVIDTRPTAFTSTKMVSVQGSICAPPSTAQAYVLNATVVPDGPLDYLTLWPDGASQPNVSTLNALDGAITSNMAIVPTNNGSVDAFADGTTNLILDFSGYFAP